MSHAAHRPWPPHEPRRGYSPVLSQLAPLRIGTLAALFTAAHPGRPLPVDRRGGLSRDLLIAPLLEAGR